MTRRLLFWLKVFVAVVLLAVIFITIEPRAIWEAMISADFSLVLVGLALMPLNIALMEYKWRYLVRLVRPQVTPFESLGSLLGGFAFGIVTPGRIGEYSRSLFIKETQPLKLVGLTVIDKFYNLGASVAVGLPALLMLPWAMELATGYLRVSLTAALFLLNALLLYFALDPRPVRNLIYALQMIVPRHGKIAQLTGGMDVFAPRHARVMLFLTMLHHGVFLVQYHFFIRAFHAIDLFSSARAASALRFTKTALPIAIGDLGLDQLASMKIFGEFGVPITVAINASLLMFGINVLIPSLAGVPFIGRLQIKPSKKKVSKANLNAA